MWPARKLVFRTHPPALRQMLDDQVDEIELGTAQLPFRDEPVKRALGRCAVEPNEGSKKQAKAMDNDLWIAACALRHSVPLISNNRKHFEKISGLQLISLALEKAPAVPTKKNLFDGDREE
jgi:hypothetical protein